ncbi:hypothetical protein ACTJJD_12595 [Bacillus sp. 22446]|uniref:hypothetical protein n=1 Tax=Bacillus sp. 22446 TaxID=3453918 RepID=UPI003F8489E2
MPPEETEIDWKGWIVDIAVNFALPMAGDYLSDLIKQHFSQNQNNMEVMFKNAVEEVCSRVAEIIDEAFLNQYLSDCRHVSNQLRIYQETNDRDVITNAQIESSRLASRLYDMGYKATGGFFIAANMHLVSLRALSEVDSTYRNTLQEFTQDYIEKGIHLNSRLNDITKGFTPSECIWYPRKIKISDPSLNDQERGALIERYNKLTNKPQILEYYDVGNYRLESNGHFYGFPDIILDIVLEIDSETRGNYLKECRRIRQNHIDERVIPLNTITNSTENVLSNWKNWKVE